MKVELMRYKNDSLSFYMNILAIVFNVVFLLCIMANLSITGNYITGIDALVNIVFMLFAFLTAEKVKAYLPKWGFVSAGLAVVQVARIFLVALPFAAEGQLTGFLLILAIFSLVASAACLVVGCVTSYIRSKKLSAYLEGLQAGTMCDTIVNGDLGQAFKDVVVEGDVEQIVENVMPEAEQTTDDGALKVAVQEALTDVETATEDSTNG